MMAGMMFMFCLFTAFFVINYYIPIWFQSVKGVSAYKSGIYFLTMSAGLSFAVIASGFLVNVRNYISAYAGLTYRFIRQLELVTLFPT